MSPYLFSNNTELASPSQYKPIQILRGPNKKNYQTTTARRECASGALRIQNVGATHPLWVAPAPVVYVVS